MIARVLRPGGNLLFEEAPATCSTSGHSAHSPSSQGKTVARQTNRRRTRPSRSSRHRGSDNASADCSSSEPPARHGPRPHPGRAFLGRTTSAGVLGTRTPLSPVRRRLILARTRPSSSPNAATRTTAMTTNIMSGFRSRERPGRAGSSSPMRVSGWGRGPCLAGGSDEEQSAEALFDPRCREGRDGRVRRRFVCLATVFPWLDGECAECPDVEHVAGASSNSSCPPGRNTRAITAMACCHWGTWWMMPKSTTVSWLAPGCWMSQTSPSRKRHSAPVQASARELDHGLVEVDRRHPSPTGTTCNSVSTTCAAISAAHRGLSNATTTTTTSASKLTALKGQKTATSRGTSWSSTSTRKPSSWAAHLRQAARARTHRRGRRGRSDGRQRPDDVVVG